MKSSFNRKVLFFQLLIIGSCGFLNAQSLDEQQIMPMIMRGVDIIDVRTDGNFQVC